MVFPSLLYTLLKIEVKNIVLIKKHKTQLIMTKKTFILVTLLVLSLGSAKAQWFDLSNNQRFSIGANIGCVGYNLNGQGIDKQYAGFGTGINMSMAGVYVDFIYQSPEHRWGRRISPDMYYDHTALAINVGYQVPVLPWLFVTPVIGYSNETTGWTDCSTLYVDFRKRTLYHPYKRDHVYSHFNYGVGLMLRPFEFIEIGAMATSHAIYGSISFSAGRK